LKEIETIKKNIEIYTEERTIEELRETADQGIDIGNLVMNMIFESITKEEKSKLTDEEWIDLLNSFVQDSYTLAITSFLLMMADDDFIFTDESEDIIE